MNRLKTSGIVGGLGLRVKITGYQGKPNKYVPPGSIGYLEPIELSIDGDVICARFHGIDPETLKSTGCGLVTWPIFESVTWDAKEGK
jgi:hypothetical protein